MHDGGERCGRVDAGQHGGQRVAVAGVAGDDTHVGAESGEVGAQLVGAGCVGAAAAGQDEPADAVAADEVPCHQGAEAARSAGDENGARGVER
ncbi:hypothetical protein GCM10020295_07450 [Streptomyces cinereospinus]